MQAADLKGTFSTFFFDKQNQIDLFYHNLLFRFYSYL